ncbi:MAG TPA: TonB-dependent siderophore receptor [Methylococcaceae bacterium]|nr:TonB-dependent siderophore receptor [Methylococcaceae bacterium]
MKAPAALALLALFGFADAPCEEHATRLDTVIVNGADADTGYRASEASTATRVESGVLETPYSVGTVSGEALRDSQVYRLEDTAMFMSGVQQSTGQSGLNTELIIRGFATGGAAYLNGVLDNQRFQVRDLALVERVEILKGHSSVLYGSGAPGGTVNYVSKKPQADSRSRLSFSSGSFGFNRLVADSTGTVDGNTDLLYRVIAVGQLSDTFRKNVPNDRATLAPSLTWQYSDRGSLTNELEYSFEDQPFRFDNVFTQGRVVFDRSYVDPRAKSARHHWRITNALSQQLAEDWSLHLTSQYFHTEREDLLFGFFTLVDENTLSGYYRDIHDHSDQHSLRGEVHGDLSLPIGRHHLILGMERNLIDDRLNSQRRIGGFTLNIFNPVFDHPVPATTRLDRDTESLEYGYYLYDKVDVADLWHFHAGVRYSSFKIEQILNDVGNEATGQDAYTYNAGLSFTPADFFAPYFGYSNSFQPNQGVDRNNALLPPKRGDLYEAGIKSSLFDRRLGLSAAVFRLSQSNLPARDPADPDFQVASGEIVSRGFEMDVAGQVTDNFQVVGNYTLMKAEFTHDPALKGNALHSVPAHSGALWAKYRFDTPLLGGRLETGGGMVFVGSRQGDDANSFTVPGYIRPDIFANYRWQDVGLQLKVENLLDKRYVSTSVFDDTVVQGNRRAVYGIVSVQY